LAEPLRELGEGVCPWYFTTGMRGKRLVPLFALLGIAGVVPAFAESAPNAQYPKCDRQPSAADVEAAKGVYTFGKRKYDEADYTAALNAFNDAYKSDCRQHDLLVIIGKTYEAMGNRAEAIRAYETYLDRVPNASDAETYRRRISNLKAQMPAPTAAPPTEQPTATGTAPPSPTLTPTASAAPSATSTNPTPPKDSQDQGGRGHTIPPWIVVGIGGAAAVTGGILYLVGAGDVSSAEQLCGQAHTACPKGSSAIDQGNHGKSLETAGGALFIGGILVAAGGLVWHFLEPTGPKQEKAGARVTPILAPGVAGLGAGGQFE
jgi:tetratricopeptide (TPR) repeat protein